METWGGTFALLTLLQRHPRFVGWVAGLSGAARLGRDVPLQVSLFAHPLAGTAAQPSRQLSGPMVRVGWVCL